MIKILKRKSRRLVRQIFVRANFVSLIFGLILGCCIVELLVLCTSSRPFWMNCYKHFDYELLDPNNTYDSLGKQEEYIRQHDIDNYTENSSIATKLYREVRVLCWVLTSPIYHEIRVRRIKHSWGKHCNKLLLMSTKADEELGIIALNVTESHCHKWGKTKAAFQYVYKHHFHEADWFLKADDDSYVILENLRYMLYPYSPESAHYFGLKYKKFLSKRLLIGGANYVLSREALRRFIQQALPRSKYCRSSDYGREVVEMAKCMSYVNVTLGETNDEHGRARFFEPFIDDFIVNYYSSQSVWLGQQQKNESKVSAFPRCCSNLAISFSNVPPRQLYVLHFMIYYHRISDVHFVSEPLPKRAQNDELIVIGGNGENVTVN